MICSISDYLSEAARFAGDRCAVREGAVGYSFAQLDRAATNIARAVIRAGAEPGDRIGVLMGKSALQAACVLGIARARCVFVVLDDRLKSRQVGHIVQDSRMRLVLTAESEGAGELAPDVPRLSLNMGPLLSADLNAAAPSGGALRSDLACLMYTSGSMGPAKGVMVSRGNLIAGTESVISYLGITESDRICSVLPFCFDYGLNQLLCALKMRCRLVLCRMVFPQDVVTCVAEEGVTVLAGIPPIWAGLSRLRRGPGSGGSLDSVRIVTNSGGAVGPKMLECVRRLFPRAQVFLMYGLTEAFRSTFLHPSELSRRPRSIGKAVPGAEVMLVTAEGKRAGPGEMGQIVHRGDTVALGYWGLPAETARVFRPDPFPRPGGGQTEYVVYSGDYAVMDEDGYLYFRGRRDGQLKVSGSRVSPEQVEGVVCEAPGVSECVVVGIEREQGHEVVAWVVGNGSMTVESLQRHCHQNLPRFLVPRRFHLIDELPRLANGKCDRSALLDRTPAAASTPAQARGDAHGC